MEDDNLLLLLNTNRSQTTKPIQQKREPLVEIIDNDNHDSVITMTCLNDHIPPMPMNNAKRHFNDIKLIRPSSASSQNSRAKKQEKNLNDTVQLKSGGKRNSTDNLIQSSIDVTLSLNSSPHDQHRRLPRPIEEELAIVTIGGAEDKSERENENPIDLSMCLRLIIQTIQLFFQI